MKISQIETFTGSDGSHAVVRVATDDGAEGFGQATLFQAGITADVLHKMVAPFFLGENPWNVERLVERCLTRTYKFPDTFILRALCGIDTAIWDLLGKVTEQPVYRLLGGLKRSEIPMHASSMRRDISPEQTVERLAEAVARDGFGCVKIRIGERMGRDQDASPGRTEQLIRLARETLGGGIHIKADANGGYSPARAIQVGRLLEEYGYYHFEEPCPYPQIENMAQVAAALDIPVAGGEQDNNLPHFHRMMQMRAVDVIQPDIGYIGGLSRARKVAELAEIMAMPCAPHASFSRSLFQVFRLHLVAAMPACGQYQGWSIEDLSHVAQVFEPEPVVQDGVIRVTDRPGWGVSITPDWLVTANRRESIAGITGPTLIDGDR